MGIVDEAAKKRDATRQALLEKEEKKAAKNPEGKKSQAMQFIELSRDHEFFISKGGNASTNGNPYAVVTTTDGIRQVFPVNSLEYEWLLQGMYLENHFEFDQTSVEKAIKVIEARARKSGQKQAVYMRVARVANNLGDKIYIDLCDDRWRVVEVSEAGWKILEKSPVNFVRTDSMDAFPLPRQGSNIMELERFLNLPNSQLKLAIAWLLGSLRGIGAYPVMVINGRNGCGKSTVSKMLRKLVDPSSNPDGAPAREIRDLVITAIDSHVLVLDNLSGIDHFTSDQLCRFSTGGGYKARKMHSDRGLISIRYEKPVLINGIDELATRPDLAERSIVLNLPVLTSRRADSRLWQDFNEAWPGLFGGLLTSLVDCLKNEQTSLDLLTKENTIPRLVNFTAWAMAAEQSMGWVPGEFLHLYRENLMITSMENIESNSVATVLLALLVDLDPDQIWQDSPDNWKRLLKNYANISKKPEGLDKKPWVISPTNLYEALSNRAGKKASDKNWPKSTKGIKNALNRIATDLDKYGIKIDHTKESGGNRYYRFSLDEEKTIDTLASLFPQVKNWYS